jgi:hypothetical protein
VSDKTSIREEAAIIALEKVASRWPRSLRLFSRSGTLEVQRNDGSPPNDAEAIVTIIGIPNDGGDT